jgi:hypothetical protein
MVMVTAKDIVCVGDKIRVSGKGLAGGKVHILAQVQANLFTLIDINDGNRLADPFPCKYGTRLRSGNMPEGDIKLYGSFTLQDLKDAVASQSNDLKSYVGERDEDRYTYTVEGRFCHEHVFEDLAMLWNKKLEREE